MGGLEAAVLRYVGPDKRQAESQLKRRVAKAVKRHQHVFITVADAAVVVADALGRMLEAELAGDAVLDPASGKLWSPAAERGYQRRWPR